MHEAVRFPSCVVAVIIAFPELWAVILPAASTDAISFRLLVQTTFLFVALLGDITAVTVVDWFTASTMLLALKSEESLMPLTGMNIIVDCVVVCVVFLVVFAVVEVTLLVDVFLVVVAAVVFLEVVVSE